jgi:hypothetical protein
MVGYGDLVCPTCQVLLPAGATVCSKCGRKGQAKTGHAIVDFVGHVRPWLVEHLGAVGGNLTAGLLFVLLALLVAGFLYLVKQALASG